MKKLLSFSLLLLTTIVIAQNSSEELDKLFNTIEAYENSIDPRDSLFNGFHIKAKLAKVTPQTISEVGVHFKQFVDQLNAIDDNGLTRQEFISKQIMLLKMENSISDVTYKMYLIPLNAEGGFYQSINNILYRLPFNTEEDYNNYLQWIPFYIEWMEDQVALMRQGIDAGIVAPKVVIQNNLALLKPWVTDDVTKHPFYSPFNKISQNIDKLVSHNLEKRAKTILEKQIIPFYKNLSSFLEGEYIGASPEEPGIKFLPKGKAYYEDRVRYYTTMSMTPDSVHALGLVEVARIKSLMESIIKETQFEGTFADFFEFLRTDEQFYPKTPQELLNRAAWLSKKAEGQLPKLFKKLYALPFTVVPVADDIAPTYTAGRYSGGSMKRQRAGEYWVNTYKLDSRTLYTLPALTLHEAVPGHHLQGSLAQEIENIPNFRNRYYISAFGEGWGLYSEFLGEEMGMYETPYERFGRYTYEMWRACRLVVDTGIHYKGWSRQQAFDYMKAYTALSLHEITTEIDRYIGWPGQAVSYKIGELKIKALRKQAEKQLGDKFDIREFHYHILKNGSVTLPILQQEIETYIIAVLNDAPHQR